MPDKLKSGTSQKTVSQNIAELHQGKTYEQTKEKFGEDKANKQSIAIALSKKRESEKKRPSHKGSVSKSADE